MANTGAGRAAFSKRKEGRAKSVELTKIFSGDVLEGPPGGKGG